MRYQSVVVTRLSVGAALLGSVFCAACGAGPGEQQGSSEVESLSATCGASVTTNTYDGPNYWGTITVKNTGPSSWNGFAISLDVPSGDHCTNDSVPSGATLSPLSGSGPSATTKSNACTFTFSGALAAGASKTFNYSADATTFGSATAVKVTSSSCSTGSGGSGGPGAPGGTGSAVGTGWVAYSPTSILELEVHDVIIEYPSGSTSLLNDGASFKNAGGIETFQMLNTTSNRVERRMPTYTSGKWQFEGEVQAFPPTDNECVMQIFGGTQSGATTQMIRAFAADNGSLRKIPGDTVIATNIWGKWVKINVIHDTSANTVKTYVNDVLVTTGSGDGPGPWWQKYGDYGTVTTGTAKVQWRNVVHYEQ